MLQLQSLWALLASIGVVEPQNSSGLTRYTCVCNPVAGNPQKRERLRAKFWNNTGARLSPAAPGSFPTAQMQVGTHPEGRDG